MRLDIRPFSYNIFRLFLLSCVFMCHHAFSGHSRSRHGQYNAARPQQPRAAVYFLTDSNYINNINILHICSRMETFSQDTNIRYKQGPDFQDENMRNFVILGNFAATSQVILFNYLSHLSSSPGLYSPWCRRG